MTLASIKFTAAIVAILTLGSVVAGRANDENFSEAYYTQVTHVTLKEFKSASVGPHFCQDKNSLQAFDYVNSLKETAEFDKGDFTRSSISWGVKGNDDWLVFLNGFQQLYFTDGSVVDLDNVELEQLVSLILSDFSNSACSPY